MMKAECLKSSDLQSMAVAQDICRQFTQFTGKHYLLNGRAGNKHLGRESAREEIGVESEVQESCYREERARGSTEVDRKSAGHRCIA